MLEVEAPSAFLFRFLFLRLENIEALRKLQKAVSGNSALAWRFSSFFFGGKKHWGLATSAARPQVSVVLTVFVCSCCILRAAF